MTANVCDKNVHDGIEEPQSFLGALLVQKRFGSYRLFFAQPFPRWRLFG